MDGSLPSATLSRSGIDLQPVRFADLPGFDADDHLAAWATFIVSARALVAGLASTRLALPASTAFVRLCAQAIEMAVPASPTAARRLFEAHFAAFRICPMTGMQPCSTGFVTGYYEPELCGNLQRSQAFQAPILARPDDLVTFPAGGTPAALAPHLSAGRRGGRGQWLSYPDRATIESHAAMPPWRPIVWLRDAVEVFLVQVQGSARVNLPDGSTVRLAYAGRNGLPYTSIGRILIDEGHMAQADMSLANLKAWIRAAGQGHGEAGRVLMQRNQSYVFFKIDGRLPPQSGPVGAAGVSLTALRSIAVDRSLWHYGLPFWLDADLPWRNGQTAKFQRMMIAQDTGSAIIGPARADIYCGSGNPAGILAGNIRHQARVHVLLPKEDAPA